MLEIKRRRALQILVPLLVVGLIAATIGLTRAGREAEATGEMRDRLPVVVEQGLVSLTEAVQSNSGMRTAMLAPAGVTAGPEVFGTALDLQPLVDLASRRAVEAAELDAAQAAAVAANAELARVDSLYRDGETASLKALEQARAAKVAAAARVRGVVANLDAIDSAQGQQYGTLIAGWGKSPAAEALAPFLAHRETLLRMVLPTDSPGAAPPLLNVLADGHAPFAAHLVSASPQSDAGFQGQAYFYRAAVALPAGLRVGARVPAAPGSPAGFRIPAEAIVWYGGQPWAYVQMDETRFVRRSVGGSQPQDGDFVVTDGFAAGQRIVVRGAQLLLSEESRATSGGQADND